jgi:hypothetical protein
VTDDLFPLFHGTSLRAAKRIATNGFEVLDLEKLVSDLETRCGVAPGTAFDNDLGYLQGYARHRVEYGDIYFTTGWRDAAIYARQGSEIEYWALQAISRFFCGDDEDAAAAWVLSHRSHQPAVITVRATLEEYSKYAPPELGPLTASLWPEPGSFEHLIEVVHERQFTGPLPAAWVATIEVLGACACDSSFGRGRLEHCSVCPSEAQLEAL